MLEFLERIVVALELKVNSIELSPGCSVEGCERAAYAKGLCAGHYQRLRLKGEVQDDVPLAPRYKTRNP